jgi:hypothetical protein
VNIDERLKVVQLNEIECETHADRARTSWSSLKTTAKDAATPWRIVTVGAVAGFLMGRSGGGAGADGGGSSVGAKLFGTVAQALITTLGSAATAGAATAAAADAAAEATSDAVAEGAATPEGRVAAAAGMHDESETDLAEK